MSTPLPEATADARPGRIDAKPVRHPWRWVALAVIAVLAGMLADEFVRPGRLTEAGAVALGTRLLRDNVRDIFKV